jgi:hypothetical protein
MQGLAALYFSGEGTPPNPSLAYYWAALSVKHYPANDPRRASAAELKATIEKNLSMGEKINLDVRGATFKPKPAPPMLAPFALLPPPAPVLRGPPPAPLSPSDIPVTASGTASFSTFPTNDEAGVTPLEPSNLPVQTPTRRPAPNVPDDYLRFDN